MYYVGASAGCMFSKYAPLLLLPIWGSTVSLNPYDWLVKFIGLYLRWRCILLLESDGICVVSCWFLADLMERLVLYVLVLKISLRIECTNLYLFSCSVLFCYHSLPLSFFNYFWLFLFLVVHCPLFWVRISSQSNQVWAKLQYNLLMLSFYIMNCNSFKSGSCSFGIMDDESEFFLMMESSSSSIVYEFSLLGLLQE